MKFPEIDQYIAQFEELARQAGYVQGNPKTTHFFLKGLAPSIVANVFWPPIVQGYQAVKEQAIQATWSKMMMDNYFGAQRQGSNTSYPPFQGFQGGAFQTFRGPRPPCQLFFTQGNQQCFPQGNQPRTPVPQNPNYNSTNAPRWINNTAVPIDMDHAQAPTWQSRGQGMQGQVAQTRNPNLQCFNCGQTGHFTRNCPQNQQSNANLIDFDERLDMPSLSGETLRSTTPGPSRIAQLKAKLDSMNFEDKMKLVQEIGTDEDFPLAWSGQHWLGRIAIAMYICQLESLWLYDSSYTLSQKEPMSRTAPYLHNPFFPFSYWFRTASPSRLPNLPVERSCVF